MIIQLFGTADKESQRQEQGGQVHKGEAFLTLRHQHPEEGGSSQ